GTIEGADNSNLDQNIEQSNDCHGFSSCNNSGRNPATIDEDNTNVEQDLDQENRCYWFSTCSNKGETEDSETSSNSQSNLCAHASNCENTGTDNDTTCGGGSDCSNSGTDTKVIGQASDCSNGADGSTRICQGPTTVEFDENGEITNSGR
ncbi:MAG: hypothetical protein ACRD47_09390, partial [Nitrososphaeraceae archaeon]